MLPTSATDTYDQQARSFAWRYPALLGTVPASPGQRVARRLIGTLFLGLGGGVGAASASLVLPANWALLDSLTLSGSAMGICAAALVETIAMAASGWTVGGRALGVRYIRLDGSKVGLRAFSRELLVTAATLVSVGIAALLIAVRSRDADGRYWHDRRLGTTLIDVRRGRDVIRHPVRRVEIDAARYPRPEVRPAVVQVGSAATAGPGLPRDDWPVPVGLPTHVVMLDSGESHAIGDRALVGRRPETDPPDSSYQLIALIDPSMTLSKTHVRLTADAQGLWVEDLGSTNGTRVVDAVGRAHTAAAQVPILAGCGSTVFLGDLRLRIGPEADR